MSDLRRDQPSKNHGLLRGAPLPARWRLDGRTIPVIEAADVHAAFIAVAGHFKPRRKLECIGIRRGWT